MYLTLSDTLTTKTRDKRRNERRENKKIRKKKRERQSFSSRWRLSHGYVLVTRRGVLRSTSAHVAATTRRLRRQRRRSWRARDENGRKEKQREGERSCERIGGSSPMLALEIGVPHVSWSSRSHATIGRTGVRQVRTSGARNEEERER